MAADGVERWSIKRYVIVVALRKHTVRENYLRVLISKNNDGQEQVCTAFCEL